MDIHLRKQVQYGHAGDNQDEPYDGSQVGHLLEEVDAAYRYKRDAERRPGGIRDADGDPYAMPMGIVRKQRLSR